MNNTDIPIPESTKRHFEETQKMIDDWEASKKLKEKINIMKRRLETVLEVKKEAEVDIVREERAVKYFEDCKKQIEAKMDDLKNKLFFIETRLSSARKKTETKKEGKKTKEQIHLEREIQEAILSFHKCQPIVNLSLEFPGLEAFFPPKQSPKVETTAPIGGDIPPEKPIEPEKPDSTDPPVEKAPVIKNKAKRVAKRVDIPNEPEISWAPEVPKAPEPPEPPKIVEPTPRKKNHPDKLPESHKLSFFYNDMNEEEKAFLFQSRPDIFEKMKGVELLDEPLVAERVVRAPRPFPSLIQSTKR